MGKSDARYAPGAITAWLTEVAGFDPAPAATAGQAIGAAWNAREFYASATGIPLLAALRAAGRPAREVDRIADALARRFGIHLHEVAAWDREPHWRKDSGT